MRLGELIAALEQADPHQVCPWGFKDPDSFRGYYDELAFAPASNVTVGAMLADARSALGATYEGWKGGDYTMTASTECWIAVRGESDGETIGRTLLRYMLAVGRDQLCSALCRDVEEDRDRMVPVVDAALAVDAAWRHEAGTGARIVPPLRKMAVAVDAMKAATGNRAACICDWKDVCDYRVRDCELPHDEIRGETDPKCPVHGVSADAAKDRDALEPRAREIGCPDCGTILNAKAAGCAGLWHADNAGSEVVDRLTDHLSTPGTFAALYDVAEAARAYRAAGAIAIDWRGSDPQVEADEVDRLHDLLFASLDALDRGEPGGVYLSTGCRHALATGDAAGHECCRMQVAKADGSTKVATRNKFTDAVCICPICRHPREGGGGA